MPTRNSGTLSPAQVAAEVGVDEKTVRNWIHAGVIEATRTPAGRYRLAPTVVLALKHFAKEMPLNTHALRESFATAVGRDARVLKQEAQEDHPPSTTR